MRDNIPHLPAEVAQEMEDEDLAIPSPLAAVIKGASVRMEHQDGKFFPATNSTTGDLLHEYEIPGMVEGAKLDNQPIPEEEQLELLDAAKKQQWFLDDMKKVLKMGHHFYLENLRLFWDLNFNRMDLSEVRMPFPITVLFYTFTNAKVGMPPVPNDGDSFEHGKSVIIVSDLYEHGMLHIHGYTENPIAGYKTANGFIEGRWMMLPASVIIDRERMVDMGDVVTPDNLRARPQAPLPGVDWDEYLDTLKKDDPNAEQTLANLMADHVRIALGFLAISAAKNVPRYTVKPSPKLNKKRLKRGKVPFTEYHVLDIFRERERVIYEAVEGVEEGDEHKRASPKLHLVRGHMVQRTSGLLYYRSPHLRGDPNKGTTNKDYRT